MADLDHSDLYVATYDERSGALRDFRVLESALGSDLGVLGAVALGRHADGKVDFLVATEDIGNHLDWFGGATGTVLALFAPELLLSGPPGQGESTPLRRLIRAHDADRIGIGLDECFPPDSAVVVLVIAHSQVHRVDGVLLHASNVSTYHIRDQDFDLVRSALAAPGDAVET